MKSRRWIIAIGVIAVALVAAIALFTSSGFSSGGAKQNRVALAKQTVSSYWSDIGHGKMAAAYGMMTSGNRASMTQQEYLQNMYGFVTSVNALKATPGTPSVHGDEATVPVVLSSPTIKNNLHAYQHLFWEGGRWHVSDANGGLSHTP